MKGHKKYSEVEVGERFFFPIDSFPTKFIRTEKGVVALETRQPYQTGHFVEFSKDEKVADEWCYA